MAGQTPVVALPPVADKRRTPVRLADDERGTRLRPAAQGALNGKVRPPDGRGGHDPVRRGKFRQGEFRSTFT
jgi:hypothetical protein